MKKLLVMLAAAAMWTACNNEGGNKAETKAENNYAEAAEDSTERVIQTSFPELFAYLNGQDSSFAADSFSLYGENKLDTLPNVSLQNGQLEPFKNLLIYNSDSSLAIDLYSYNYIITERNGQRKMEAAGPDTEVGLVDVKANTRKRLFFSGPSTTVYDARWINENEVVLAGVETAENNQIKPAVWQINLADSSMQIYLYDNAITANMDAYKNTKLKTNL